MTRADCDQLRAMLEEIAAELEAAPAKTDAAAKADLARRFEQFPSSAGYLNQYPHQTGALQASCDISARRIRALIGVFFKTRRRAA